MAELSSKDSINMPKPPPALLIMIMALVAIACTVVLPFTTWPLAKTLQGRVYHAIVDRQKLGEHQWDALGLDDDTDMDENRSRVQLLKSAILSRDMFLEVKQSKTLSDMHSAAETFSPAVEDGLRLFQVPVACCLSVFHGAAAVNSFIEPFAACYMVYKNEQAVETTAIGIPMWLHCGGAVAMGLGCLLCSYNNMALLGVRMAKLTTSRALAINLATAMALAIEVYISMPVCYPLMVTCATVAVGAMEGNKHTSWRLLTRLMLVWSVNTIAVGLAAAGLVAVLAFTPSAPDLRELRSTGVAVSDALSAVAVLTSNATLADQVGFDETHPLQQAQLLAAALQHIQ